MAQDIEVKIKVNTDSAVKDVNSLGNAFDQTKNDAIQAQNVLGKTGDNIDLEPSINNLKNLKNQLKATAVGSKEFDKLSMSIRDMEDAIGDAKKGNDDFLGQMENAPGILGMLGKGIRGAESATSSFGGALKATGIGLIVALLGGLVSAFSGNEVAMKKIQPLFDGLKKITYGIFKVIEPLVDVFMDLAMEALPYVQKAIGGVYAGMMAYFTFLKEAGGGAMQILEGIFTLDADKITGGIDKVSGSFGKAGDTFKDSMKKFGEGTKQLTESEQEALEKQKELLAKQKEARDKANAEAEAKRKKELEEREAFNKEIADLEKKQAESIRDAKAKTDQEKLDLQAQRDLEEIEALRKKGANVELLMKQHNEKYTLLDADLQEKLAKEKKEKDDEKKKKEEEDARTKFEKDQAENLLRNQNQMEVDNLSFEEQRTLVNEREQILLADKTLTDQQRIAIHKATADAQQQIDEKKAQATENVLKAVSQSMDIAQDLIGKNTVAGKAMAVASALINTYQGITAGLKLGYPMAIPAVAMAAVTGFKAVKDILATKVPGASGGGATPSISAPQQSMPSSNVVASSGVNQLASTMVDQPPVKAFVVANDVTTQQGLNRNIVSTASL